MRKITSILMLLALFVSTSWAETIVKSIGSPVTSLESINSDTWYVLCNFGRNSCVSEETTQMKMRVNVAKDDVKNDILGKLFKITKQSDGSYYIQSGNGKYFSLGDNTSAVSETAVPYTIGIRDNDSNGHFYLQDKNSKYVADGQQRDNAFVGWETTIPSGSCGNNCYQLLPVEFCEGEQVTYNYIYDGVKKKTVTVWQEVDTPISAPAYDFVTITNPEGTILVNGENVYNVNCTANLPFEMSDNFSNAKWYYLRFADNQNYLYYDSNLDHFPVSKTFADVTPDNVDTYSWAFIGNPFDGFTIINKGAGQNMVLTSDEPANETAAPNTFPVMAEGSQLWMLTVSTDIKNVNGFYVALGNTGKRLNNRGSKLAYWTTGANAGSTFSVQEVDANFITECQAAVDAVKEFLQGVVGTTVGYVTAESVASLQAVVTAAETAISQNENCFDHIAALNTAMSSCDFVTIQPSTGAYYRIVSSCTRDHRGGQIVYVDNAGEMHFAIESHGNATSLGYVFQFENANDGKFYVRNVERGTYLWSNGGNSTYYASKDKETAKPVTIANMGKDNIVSIIADGANMMHAQDAQSKVVGWNETNVTDGSAWIIEEVDIANVNHPVTLGDAGWASLNLGYDATIPTGVTAYAVSKASDLSATLDEVKDAIPANCPVLISGTAGTTYNFAVAASANAVDKNELLGTVLDENVPGDAYVLAKPVGAENAGLYKAMLNKNESGADVETDGTHFKNNAFKAYLPASALGTIEGEAPMLIFSFGTETAIEGVAVKDAGKAVIYDLSGRRVKNAQKGIFIINGKKVVK